MNLALFWQEPGSSGICLYVNDFWGKGGDYLIVTVRIVAVADRNVGGMRKRNCHAISHGLSVMLLTYSYPSNGILVYSMSFRLSGINAIIRQLSFLVISFAAFTACSAAMSIAGFVFCQKCTTFC